MRTLSAILVICALSAMGANAQTKDTVLDVELLPNTSYDVQATVGTSALDSLIALLAGGPSPIQIVDDLGNVLAELSAAELIQALTDADGGPAVVNLEVNTAETVGEASQLVVRVTDTPLLQVLGVSAAPRANRPPGVANIKKQLRGANQRTLDVRGKAKDPDGSVRKVEVFYKGKLRRTNGKENWRSVIRLSNAQAHRVVVRAIDDQGQPGPKKQFVVRPRK